MRSIKLHINKLGLVENADLVITPMMVFSGESGLGKSYVAILCHYFFSVWLNEKRLDSFFKSALANRSVDFHDSSIPETGMALSITKEELENWLASDSIAYLGYMLGYENFRADIKVQLPDSIGESITFNYEQEKEGINNNENLYWKLSTMSLTYRFGQLGIQSESPYSFVLRFAMIAEIFGDYKALAMTFALPPSRGSYFTEKITPITGLFKNFVEGMSSLEAAREIPDTVSQESVDIFHSLMNGKVQKSGDKYIYKTNGDELPITAAASSVREMAPLQLLVTKRDISKMSLLVEEPEAHLHPIKQRLMAEALVSMAIGGASMQITTHSDYLLRRINDLLRLGAIKKKRNEIDYLELCKEYACNPHLALDTSLLSAYYLEKRAGDNSVQVIRQDTSNGVPFDTFKEINGKPLYDSSMLYEISLED